MQGYISVTDSRGETYTVPNFSGRGKQAVIVASWPAVEEKKIGGITRLGKPGGRKAEGVTAGLDLQAVIRRAKEQGAFDIEVIKL